LKEVFRPVWSDVRDVWTRDIFRGVFRERPGRLEGVEDSINQSLGFEARTFLHGLLVVEDKLSMAHGLETRVPFLDNDLVDFAVQVPVRLKVRASIDVFRIDENSPGDKGSLYNRRTRDGKVLLRRMMERYVPPEITGSEKQGFSAPDASWFRGESIDYVRRILFDEKARIFDYLDAGAVRKLVDDHLNGTSNRRLFIWSLLNFEQWCKVFLP
jgi:asparagine synthase (glutamine-hydrolysing)